MAIPGGDIYGWRKLDAEKAYQNSLVGLGRRRLFARDNGAGKTRLVINGPGGGQTVLSTEP